MCETGFPARSKPLKPVRDLLTSGGGVRERTLRVEAFGGARCTKCTTFLSKSLELKLYELYLVWDLFLMNHHNLKAWKCLATPDHSR